MRIYIDDLLKAINQMGMEEFHLIVWQDSYGNPDHLDADKLQLLVDFLNSQIEDSLRKEKAVRDEVV